MGGSLGSAFSQTGQSGTPANPNDPNGAQKPSFLQSLVQGATKGAGKGFGQATQQQNRGPAQLPPAPSATPVDPRFFQPTGPAGGGSSPFYG